MCPYPPRARRRWREAERGRRGASRACALLPYARARMTKTRAFVTGGSGFVGGALIRSLVQDGVEVTALARSQTAADTVQKLGALPARGDLDDESMLRTRMGGCDVVYHAAAHTQEWGPVDD